MVGQAETESDATPVDQGEWTVNGNRGVVVNRNLKESRTKANKKTILFEIYTWEYSIKKTSQSHTHSLSSLSLHRTQQPAAAQAEQASTNIHRHMTLIYDLIWNSPKFADTEASGFRPCPSPLPQYPH